MGGRHFAVTKKARNPQDTTLRNARAAARRSATLHREIVALAARLTQMEQAVAVLQQFKDQHAVPIPPV